MADPNKEVERLKKRLAELASELKDAEQVLSSIAKERESLNAPGPKDWLLGVKLVEMAEQYFIMYPRPLPPRAPIKNINLMENKESAAEIHGRMLDPGKRRKGELRFE